MIRLRRPTPDPLARVPRPRGCPRGASRRAGPPAALVVLAGVLALASGCHDVAPDDGVSPAWMRISVVNWFDWDGFHPQPLRVQVDRGSVRDLPFGASRPLSVRPGAHTLHLWDDARTFELRVPVHAETGALEVAIGRAGSVSVRLL